MKTFLVGAGFLILVHLRQSQSAICPRPGTGHEVSGPPRFTTNAAGSADYVTVGNSYAIQCCCDGFESISWYKKTPSAWAEYLPSGSGPSGPSLEEQGQILSFKEVTTDDAGTYRCVPRNEKGEVNRTLALYVNDCIPRGPRKIAPVPRDVKASTGETVTFPCIGDFGCDKDFRLITWLISDVTSDDWKQLDDFSDRYNVTRSSSDGEVLSANLTISNITEEDFSRKFMCLLATPQVVDGQLTTVVRMLKGDEGLEEASFYLPIVISTAVVSFIFIMVSLALYIKIRKQNTRHKEAATLRKDRTSLPLI